MSTRGRLSTADMAKVDEPVEPAPSSETRADAPAKDVPVRHADDESPSPLFAQDASQGLWQRWDALQAGFVDEPRRAVEEADALVADTMKRLAETFARERDVLEKQWDRGDDVSTEDLRLALQRYRSFFKRLLSV
jgi:hypothetical protein